VSGATEGPRTGHEPVRDIVANMRASLTAVGDFDNELLGVPASGVRGFIERLEAALAADEARAPVAHTSERHFALREAHGHADEEAYFKARPHLDAIGQRVAFRAGHVRGFDAAEKAYAHPPAPAAQAPLPLLVRDIAADFGVTPLAVCEALRLRGLGHYSVNMAVTADVARELRAHFAQAAPAAQAEQPATDTVPLPQNVAQAEVMAKVGVEWLRQHAPDRLTPAERGEQPAQGLATMFDSPQVTAMWQTFGRGHEFRQSVKWAQDGEIPGALFVAFRAGLSAALASAQQPAQGLAELADKLQAHYGHHYTTTRAGMVAGEHHDFTRHPLVGEAVRALRGAALAPIQQPAQGLAELPEPEGFSAGDWDGALFSRKRRTATNFAKGAMVQLQEWYSADQMRAALASAPRVPLTAEQIVSIGGDAFGIDLAFDGRLMGFARAIERAHGIAAAPQPEGGQ
jgi:hypothetical protein